MPFSGGTFSRLYNWVTDKGAGVKITASKMDDEFDGIATGLSTCLLRDGTSTPTANIPFNNMRITGLGDAAAVTDALNRQSADDRYWTPTPAAKGTVTTGTVSFSIADGPRQTITVGGAQIWQITSKPSSDDWYLWITVTNGGSATITMPTVSWFVGDGTTSATFSNMGVTLQTSGVNQILLWGSGSGTVYGRAM